MKYLAKVSRVLIICILLPIQAINAQKHFKSHQIHEEDNELSVITMNTASETSSDYSYRLDSTVSDFNKYYYLLDSNNAKHILLRVKKDVPSNKWNNYKKYVYIVNEKNQIVDEKYYNWDSELQSWTIYYNFYYVFDSYGNQIVKKWLNIKGNVVTNGTLDSIQYNNYKKQEILSYNWDIQISGWLPNHKVEYVYSENNLSVSNEYLYKPDLLDFEKVSYTLHYYEPDGTAQYDTTFKFDTFTSEWIYGTSRTHNFSENGEEVFLLSSTFINKTWQCQYKVIKDFNSFGQQTLFEDYNWDHSNNVWLGSRKSVTQYDELGNDTTFSSYSWDNSQDDWLLSNKTVKNYELSVGKDDIQPHVSFYFKNMCLSQTYYPGESSSSEPYTTVYYYTNLNTSDIKICTNSKNFIYPNPVSNQFYISTNNTENTLNLILYDISGKIIIDRMVNNESSIDVCQLNKGIYFYYLSSSTTKGTGKLIIK